MKLREWRDVFHESWVQWRRDNPGLIAAGLSFFTLFSLAPLLLLLITIIGVVFETASAQDLVIGKSVEFLGPEAASSLQEFLAVVSLSSGSVTFFSVLLLLWGGARIFSQLQGALNMIGEKSLEEGVSAVTKRRWRRIARTAFGRLRALSMVGAFGFVLFLSFVADIGMGAAVGLLDGLLPSVAVRYVVPAANYVISLFLFSLLFAVVYKWLPQSSMPWQTAFAGGAVASLIFATGRYLMSLYFRFTDLASVYGVFGSVVIILFWVYFAMQILLFGAEFAGVLTRRGRKPA